MAFRRRKSLPRNSDYLLFTVARLNLNIQYARKIIYATLIITITIIFYVTIFTSNIGAKKYFLFTRRPVLDFAKVQWTGVRNHAVLCSSDGKSWWSLRESAPRTVKSNRKGKRTHDTQQWTIPIDASGPRCKLSVLWLQSCICDSLNQDVTTVSSYARLFFFARERDAACVLSFFRTADSNAASIRFYHDGTTPLISNTHLVFGCVNLNAH